MLGDSLSSFSGVSRYRSVNLTAFFKRDTGVNPVITALLILLFLSPVKYSNAAVFINEVMYNPLSGSPGYQWIELYNSSDMPVSLNNWQILTAGASFSTILTFGEMEIPPYGFLMIAEEYFAGGDVYAGLNLYGHTSGTVGIRLKSPQGYTDTVLYGQPNTNLLPDDHSSPATSFAPITPQGFSLARISDGFDTGNNENDWFASAIPTPGSSNVFPVDLALEDLSVTDLNGTARISVRVINPSAVTIPQGSASLRLFLNNECQGFYHLPELLAEYHSTEYINLEGLNDGYFLIDVRLLYQFDPDLANNHLHTSFITGSSPLVLNELLFKQTAGNQEWVEIYNRSDFPVIMENFYLEDAAATRTNFSGVIPAKTYMVICRNKPQFLDFYHYVAPELVIESSSWAILNNDRETLFIADQYGNVFDYTEYTAPASYPADLSLERINPYDDDSLWDRCIHPEMSTPAAQNSRLPLQYDLVIMENSIAEESGKLKHTLLIFNAGYNIIDNFFLKCYAYYDEAVNGELIFQESFSMTEEGSVVFHTNKPAAGYTTYRYMIESSLDLDPSNNVSFAYYNKGSLPVVVNEIMFRPFVGEPRWIELKVNGSYKYLSSVTLKTERYKVEVPVSGYEYIILVNNPADSLFMTENYDTEKAAIVTGLTSIYVSGEELRLFDPSGNFFEHFTYDPDWSKTRGVSAERINPLLPSTEDNWAHSIDPAGSTPGQKNSIHTPFIAKQTTLSLSPNPFSPNRGERTIISIELPERLSRITCRIFDLKGRLINTIVNQEIFASRSTIIWDGTGEGGRPLPAGVYIIIMEATSSDTEKTYRRQTTAVIGR